MKTVQTENRSRRLTGLNPASARRPMPRVEGARALTARGEAEGGGRGLHEAIAAPPKKRSRRGAGAGASVSMRTAAASPLWRRRPACSSMPGAESGLPSSPPSLLLCRLLLRRLCPTFHCQVTWRKLGSKASDSSFSTWLHYIIVCNILLNRAVIAIRSDSSLSM